MLIPLENCHYLKGCNCLVVGLMVGWVIAIHPFCVLYESVLQCDNKYMNLIFMQIVNFLLNLKVMQGNI